MGRKNDYQSLNSSLWFALLIMSSLTRLLNGSPTEPFKDSKEVKIVSIVKPVLYTWIFPIIFFWYMTPNFEQLGVYDLWVAITLTSWAHYKDRCLAQLYLGGLAHKWGGAMRRLACTHKFQLVVCQTTKHRAKPLTKSVRSRESHELDRALLDHSTARFGLWMVLFHFSIPLLYS